MRKLLPIFVLLCFKLNAKELELKTNISAVTVFQSGAQVTRKGSTAIPAGEYDVVIRDATSLLKKESILVKGDGNFTILSVNHQVTFDDQNMNKPKWAELDLKEKDLKRQMEDLSIKIEVLRTEEDVINNLKGVNTTTEGITVDQVSKAQELLMTKMTLIKNDKLTASRKMKELYDAHQKVMQELTALRTPKQDVKYEIVIKVSAKVETKADFEVSYIVPNAHWYPTYDLRVKTVADPMVIDYKANVSQQTGEDWNNVKLKLSTGDPSQSSQKPKIDTWLLYLNQAYVQPKQQSNYYKYTDAKFTKVNGNVYDAATGEALPFCSVYINGTNVGATTDLNGFFNMVMPETGNQLRVTYVGYEAQTVTITGEKMKIYLKPSAIQLEEVEMIRGGRDGKVNIGDEPMMNAYIKSMPGVYGQNKKNEADKPIAAPVLNIVSTEFNIEQRYTIISDPKNITVTIQSIQSNVKYQYYCAPRLEKDVFLTAQMVDWEQYNLLEGQANVFFEGTFIGSTFLDARFLTDTLEISLGRDKSVKVERVKAKEYNKRQLIGSDNIASRQWDITVRNGKQQNVEIMIEDQFPLSTDSKIEVKQQEKSGGELNESTGVVTWQHKLEPGGTKTMTLKYSVKYPKGTFIGLD